MELSFEPRVWQSPDGQGVWFFKTEVWGKKTPTAQPELLGNIEEADAGGDSWTVYLNGSDLDGNEYIGIATAEDAVRDYYAARENPTTTPAP